MRSDTMLRPGPRSRRSSMLGIIDSWSARLAPDLLRQAVGRLRVVALLFAFAFLMANFVASAFSAGTRAATFGRPIGWLPGALSVLVGVAVAWMTIHPRIPDATKLDLGLGFEVFGSFGITFAQWWGLWSGIDVLTFEQQRAVGISWVAVWMVLFTVVVPAAPRKALVATLASGAAVPLTVALSMMYGGTPPVSPFFFFWGFVFPYLVITPVAAHVSAKVVFQLSREVGRAREMGSYELIEPLGKGGMGEVWRARHRLLVRPAAVKVIRPEVLESSGQESAAVAIQRFEREAQATASMRCPHTIQLYDFGVTDEGAFYYVMELLDGFDLETLVQRFGSLAPERVVHLLKQLCHALSEAHGQGLIHRDIKPGNIYVCRYGREYDWVKVLDFGLVRRMHEGGASEARLTGEMVVGGTPAYMAPEQVTEEYPIDARTDLYAVGCVAYWALTGTIVFPVHRPMEMMMQHVKRTPDAPSRRSETPIPAALEEIVLRCLAKRPEERPQSAEELAVLLAECATDLEPWTRERAKAWWVQHRPGVEGGPADRKPVA